jgi:hypothetical protein
MNLYSYILEKKARQREKLIRRVCMVWKLLTLWEKHACYQSLLTPDYWRHYSFLMYNHNYGALPFSSKLEHFLNFPASSLSKPEWVLGTPRPYSFAIWSSLYQSTQYMQRQIAEVMAHIVIQRAIDAKLSLEQLDGSHRRYWRPRLIS